MQTARTPSSFPARAAPRPPARPSVYSRLRRARLERPTAKRPRTMEPHVAPVACRSVTRSSWRAAAKTATGSASPSSAHNNEPRAASLRARALLLLVRASIGGWRDGAADHAGDRDQGQDVRQRLEERRVRVRPRIGVRQPERQRRREAEQERSAERAERPPVAEDERREGDEAPARGHVLVERADEADGEKRSAQRGEHSRRDYRRVANGVDVDAHRVRSARMLAAGPDAQADRGAEQDDIGDRDEDDRDPDQEI